MSQGGYTVSINGSLLFNKLSLPYGEHRINLTNVDSNNILTFNRASITTGDGRSEWVIYL
jgi:hypothetical protein